MSISGHTNGVIVTKNANSSIKSEVIDMKVKDNCLAKSLTQLKTSIGSVNCNSNVMIFCGQKSRQRNDSVSSMSTISTTNVSNPPKQEVILTYHPMLAINDNVLTLLSLILMNRICTRL